MAAPTPAMGANQTFFEDLKVMVNHRAGGTTAH